MKRFFVIHDEAQDFGLRAPEFKDRETAVAARDEWNEDFPGHRVLEIEEVDHANAEAHGRAVARTVQPLVGHSESGVE